MTCLRNKIADKVLLDGRFETIAPLNHGSFGMVFMAKDCLTNETVAIKCLTKKAAAAAGEELAFAIDDKSEELELHGRLGKHDNIVSLVHSFETDAHIYLVLEFCPRGDLYEAILKEQAPAETERVRQFMLELVDAVDFMHSKGIFHRDIKPENIFLTQDGTPKLGDFGLATTETWSMESAVGSDRYMSPEQYDSAGAGFSPGQADIWALGICLLNILFSRNPFEKPTEDDRLFLDFRRDRQSLFDVFPTMSQDAYDVLMHCLSLDPKRRSLAGLRAALNRVVSFTTDGDTFDDYCNNDDQHAGVSSNREPLRTPSLQSPKTAGTDGAFPWYRAMQTGNRLDTIVDEPCAEEGLQISEESSTDWFLGAGNTPSTASVLDSALGASAVSGDVRGRAIIAPRPVAVRESPIAGSLPITMSKPRAIPAASVWAPSSQGISKSWSDMWEEDEEEERAERARQLQSIQEVNSRSYSSDSAHDDTVVPTPDDDDDDDELVLDDMDELVEDGFFVHDTIVPVKPAAAPVVLAQALPAPNQAKDVSSVDKWAALGERRRAYTGESESFDVKSFDHKPLAFGGSSSNRFYDMKPRRQFAGLSPTSGIGCGPLGGGAAGGGTSPGSSYGWEHNTGSVPANYFATRDRARDRPSFTKGRDWHWRRDAKRVDQQDA